METPTTTIVLFVLGMYILGASVTWIVLIQLNRSDVQSGAIWWPVLWLGAAIVLFVDGTKQAYQIIGEILRYLWGRL